MAIVAGSTVLPYSISTLKGLLANFSQAAPSFIDSKLHVGYFEAYFSALAAKTIVVERDYLDHDYLEDFAGYYVRCFTPYRRTATRLHFFSRDFSEPDFLTLVRGERTPLSQTSLQEAYLGFVVVKPLPMTIIGRTALSTYPDDNGRRHFPIRQVCAANLYGIGLAVETLAFQEQDSVVAACATSALWSVFQGTGKLFHHAIPSPVEITKSAAAHIPHDSVGSLPDGRTLPNTGLTATQMAYAVRAVGLEPFLFGVGDPFALQSATYAYLRAKIPLLLGIELGEDVGNVWTPFGRHAVALTGYSLGLANPVGYPPTGFLSRASRIDKLYGHDDQVGPFARMPLIPANGRLATQWPKRANPGTGNADASPVMLLVPLYHKIRIPFEEIQSTAVQLDSIIEVMRGSGNLPLGSRLEWDIFLTTVNEVKTDWFLSQMPPNAREAHLTQALPKHLWRVIAREQAQDHLDLLFDATDIAQGKLFVAGLDKVGTVAVALRAFAQAAAPTANLLPSVRAVLEYFSASP